MRNISKYLVSCNLDYIFQTKTYKVANGYEYKFSSSNTRHVFIFKKKENLFKITVGKPNKILWYTRILWISKHKIHIFHDKARVFQIECDFLTINYYTDRDIIEIRNRSSTIHTKI